jgi:hypothetical protein
MGRSNSLAEKGDVSPSVFLYHLKIPMDKTLQKKFLHNQKRTRVRKLMKLRYKLRLKPSKIHPWENRKKFLEKKIAHGVS